MTVKWPELQHRSTLDIPSLLTLPSFNLAAATYPSFSLAADASTSYIPTFDVATTPELRVLKIDLRLGFAELPHTRNYAVL